MLRPGEVNGRTEGQDLVTGHLTIDPVTRDASLSGLPLGFADQNKQTKQN